MPLGAGLAWTNDPLPCWMVMARPRCRGEQHRGGAACLVLGHSVPCGEDSGPDGPGLLIDPGPELVGVLVGVGWLGHGVDCGGVCHVVETPGWGGC